MSYSRREALAVTAQKKRECNTKALRIVEMMLDDNVNRDWLIYNLKYISQSHFQDAIEERAISKHCGYPLCNECLGNIPKQQYHISVKTNKVYDITERKYFCSNYCYKAAQFLKEQLLTSPVWLRDIETIPPFMLLSPNSPGGNYGKEVELDSEKSLIERKEKDDKDWDTPTPISSKESSVQLFRKESSEGKGISFSDQDASGEKHHHVVTSDIPHENHYIVVEEARHLNESKDVVHEKAFKEQSKRRKSNEKPINCIQLVGGIEKCFSEWFTLDSLIFIYGNEKAKEMLKDRVDHLKSNSHCPETRMDPVMERKYANLCKKLNILEIEDSLESDGQQRKESIPLPNLEQLREDAKSLEIKVKEFYKGSKVVKFNIDPSHGDPTDASCIPLIDSYAQNALRRRIILDRLRHILPDLLRTLGMISTDISEDVRGLFMTFALKADNITFKPAEWNLIGLIVLKMLSMRNTKLKTLLATHLAQNYCTMILMTFQLDYGYLDRLLSSLCESEILLNVVL